MNRQSRRKFVLHSLALATFGLLSGCAALPWQPRRPARVPRVGLLLLGGLGVVPAGISGMSPPDAFLDGLRELGYVDGQTMTLESRWAENRTERLGQLASELVSLEVDVIAVSGNAAIRAALDTTSTTPIVMLVSADPVGDGFVTSLSRPGGNLTGLSSNAVNTVGKRLELLREIRPSLRRLAVLWNTAEASKVREFDELRSLAQRDSLEIVSVGVTGLDDFDQGLATLAQVRPDALMVLEDPLMAGNQRGRIADFTLLNRLPLMSEGTELVRALLSPMAGIASTSGAAAPATWTNFSRAPTQATAY